MTLSPRDWKRFKIRKIIERDMPENLAFVDVIARLGDHAPIDYFSSISQVFGWIWRHQDGTGCQFSGFPLHTFFEILLVAFPELEKRKDVLTTVTLMAEDVGYLREDIEQWENNNTSIIGTRLHVR